jgi:hypothetical protein
MRMTESSFSMVRLSKAKKAVDLCPNTIREYNRQGLHLYRMGKAVFFNTAELEAFIRSKATTTRAREPVMG